MKSIAARPTEEGDRHAGKASCEETHPLAGRSEANRRCPQETVGGKEGSCSGSAASGQEGAGKEEHVKEGLREDAVGASRYWNNVE